MASRYDNKNNSAKRNICFLEMMIVKRNDGIKEPQRKIVMLDSDSDAVKFAQEEMDLIIANIVKVTKMEKNRQRKIEETSKIFERTLEPWFSLVSATEKNGHLLDKLSSSLKKAVILLAMDRFSCNRATVAKALGLTSERLNKEMAICGIERVGKTA